MKLPTINQLKKVAQRLPFKPKEPGPLAVIVDVGNVEYYKQRAIEFIRCDDLENAARLLTLAQVMKEIVRGPEPC